MIFINAIEIRTGATNDVLFMSDWLSVDALISEGLMRETYLGGNFNAYSLFVTPKGFAVANQQSTESFVPFGAN